MVRARMAKPFSIAAVVIGSWLACETRSDPSSLLPAQSEVTALAPIDLGDIDAVYRALTRPHREIRDQLGPHRLTATIETSLLPTSDEDPLPARDAPVVPEMALRDKIELLWRPSGKEPSFSLSQHNSRGDGRDVIALQGKLWTRLEHRNWQQTPLETEVYELWLDDAQGTAADAFAFIGPNLALQADAPGQFRLARGEATGFVAPTGPRSDWRQNVTFERIEGQLEIDPQTGIWSRIDLETTYLVSAGSRDLRGHLVVHATLDSAEVNLSPPPIAQPLHERIRLAQEKQQILDGLAAP